jgi:hypothetical protein
MKKLWIIFIAILSLSVTQLLSQTAKVTEDENQDLYFLLANNDLLKDVNATFSEIWKNQVFEHELSDRNRMDMFVRKNMTALGIPVEKTDLGDPRGLFEDESLQQLYDNLTATGSQSVVHALQAAGELEERMIIFLEKALSRTENLEVILLYDRLRAVSKTNLRVISEELLTAGINYRPKVMSDQYFDNNVM